MEMTRVDLRGLEPGGQGWADAQAAATASMVAHSCIAVAHDALGPERAVAPMDAFGGYTRNTPGYAIARESLRVPEPTDHGHVHDFVNQLWPDQGNPSFCDTVVPFATKLLKLENTVHTMILQGLGVHEERVNAHLESLSYAMRMSRYGLLPDAETLSMHAHRDHIMITVIISCNTRWRASRCRPRTGPGSPCRPTQTPSPAS
ncbi:hypothetical protein ACQ4PT_059440 [Festuca glaucescens]